jgi:hypothetical protein
MISEVIEQILDAKKKTESRRKDWQNKTKKVIDDALKKAVNELRVKELGGFVSSSRVYKNFEAIQLSLGNEASGIIEEKPNSGLRHFVKKNGYINFAQVVSGKILVIYTSPCIEEIGDNASQEVKDKVDPIDVTEDWVLGHVEGFLKEY